MRIKLELILEVEDEATLDKILEYAKQPSIEGTKWKYISVKVIDKQVKPE